MKLLFICHGNICRSTMAESVMAHLVARRGLRGEIQVDSAATSREEIGNPVHPGTRRVLSAHDIPVVPHRARQLTREDGKKFDYLIGMDGANRRNILRLTDRPEKVHLLLDWTASPRDIADPWYTGDFETTFADVWAGCSALLEAVCGECRDFNPSQTKA